MTTAVERHVRNAASARTRGDLGALKPAVRLVVAWHTPLALAVRDWVTEHGTPANGSGKQPLAVGVAARLAELDPEVVASLALQEIVSMLMQDFEWMTVAELTNMIGRVVEAEIGDRRGKKLRALAEKAEREMEMSLEKAPPLDSTGYGVATAAAVVQKGRKKESGGEQKKNKKNAKYRLYTIMNKPGVVSALNYRGTDVDATPWTAVEAVHVGATVLDLVMSSAFVENDIGELVPAFKHKLFYSHKIQKTVGKVLLNKAAQAIIVEDQQSLRVLVKPKMQPMVVPPLPWLSPDQGPYLTKRTQLVRAHSSRLLDDALAAADFQEVLDGLNALGECAWMVNRPLYNVASSLWEEKRAVAGLVDRHDVPMPKASDYYEAGKYSRLVDEQRQLRGAAKALEKEEGGDTAGFSVGEDLAATTSGSGVEGGIYESKIFNAAEVKELRGGFRTYRTLRRKAIKKNRELFSLRANTGYEMDQAAAFVGDERFYLPHNVDFRGRAYPLPGYLQHMRADNMRAMLTFAGPGIPLGERGVYWLKVHLANKLGSDKLPFEGRIAVAEEAIPRALKAAQNPLADANLEWWSTKSDPFQLLAACFEIEAAMGRDGNETSMRSFHSTLPVAMDGSCNGLQHYAALGRDEHGGLKVNLIPSARPQDVYTGVAELVQKRVNAEAAAGNIHAQVLLGKVNRKVVKQTVMTSVYGVTLIGARKQLANRLREQGMDDEDSFNASLQLARWTTDALADMFSGARQTMDWLASAAASIARSGSEVQWLTPLGLPVVQPYRKVELSLIQTSMQRISVGEMGEHMPVASQQQTTAFSPNFVHSVDSSHMLMTASACRRAGIQFASVHDSFWAHAANVDGMNRLLREKFIELHSRELLVELRDSMIARHPKVNLPDLPERGDLKIESVLESPYFFS